MLTLGLLHRRPCPAAPDSWWATYWENAYHYGDRSRDNQHGSVLADSSACLLALVSILNSKQSKAEQQEDDSQQRNSRKEGPAENQLEDQPHKPDPVRNMCHRYSPWLKAIRS